MNAATAVSHLSAQVRVGEDAMNFMEALCNATRCDAGLLLEFLEKPWKWAAEFAAWTNADKPRDPLEAGWNTFYAGIQS